MEIKEYKFDHLVEKYQFRIKLIKESIQEYQEINQLGTWDSMIKMKQIRLKENENALELLLDLKV